MSGGGKKSAGGKHGPRVQTDLTPELHADLARARRQVGSHNALRRLMTAAVYLLLLVDDDTRKQIARRITADGSREDIEATTEAFWPVRALRALAPVPPEAREKLMSNIEAVARRAVTREVEVRRPSRRRPDGHIEKDIIAYIVPGDFGDALEELRKSQELSSDDETELLDALSTARGVRGVVAALRGQGVMSAKPSSGKPQSPSSRRTG